MLLMSKKVPILLLLIILPSCITTSDRIIDMSNYNKQLANKTMISFFEIMYPILHQYSKGYFYENSEELKLELKSYIASEKVIMQNDTALDFECSQPRIFIYIDSQLLQIGYPLELITFLQKKDFLNGFIPSGVIEKKGPIPWVSNETLKALNINTIQFAIDSWFHRKNVNKSIPGFAFRASDVYKFEGNKILMSFEIEAQVVCFNKEDKVEFCVPISSTIYPVLIIETNFHYNINIYADKPGYGLFFMKSFKINKSELNKVD